MRPLRAMVPNDLGHAVIRTERFNRRPDRIGFAGAFTPDLASSSPIVGRMSRAGKIGLLTNRSMLRSPAQRRRSMRWAVPTGS